MTTPQELPRQVRQNKKDIEELYALSDKTNNKVNAIAHVQQEHGEKLARMEATLGTHGQRLDTIDGRLDTIDGRLDSVETTQGEHTAKLDEILGILRPAG